MSNTKQKFKVASDSFYGTGKRKSAIAKVWVFKGSGVVSINKKPANEYLNSAFLVDSLVEPLKVLNLDNKYDIFVKSLGGGLSGQAEAIKLGVSRALVSMNSEFRSSLKNEGLLSRDSRVKERKKYGRKRARKGYQFRKR